MNQGIKNVFSRHTENVYFDCTNYYFEIDFECDDKQKGSNKENRPNPIIGQALLLDSEGIPLGMKMYPGNESEKPKIREVISDLKKQNNISGKTTQIADKGLNCGDNIFEAIKDLDGYIFSQSVLKLEEKEKKIIKLKRVITYNPSLAKKKKLEISKLIDKAKNLCFSKAKKEEYGEASKYVIFVDDKGEKAKTLINQDKIDKDIKYAGYNLLVTSELKMSEENIFKVYHNLWRIEDTFRILKYHLEVWPVYLQKKESIYGHFLICYYAITLLRLLEEKIFKDTFNVYELKEIIRNLIVLKDDKTNTNLTKRTSLIDLLCNKYNFPIDYYYLKTKDIEKLFKYSYKIKR